MKTLHRYILTHWLLACALIMLAFVAVACVSTNPDYPVRSSEPYTVSPALTNAATSLRGVAAATNPVNPYSPVTSVALEAVLAIALAVSAYIAKRKNDEAKAERLTADSFAETLVAANLGPKALQTASINGVLPQAAKHIDNNTLAP